MEHKSKFIIAITLLLAANAYSQELKQCLAVTDDAARLACYDSASGYAGSTSPAANGNSAMVTKTIATKAIVSKAVEPTMLAAPIEQPAGAQAFSDSTLLKAQKAYDQVVADSALMLITKIQTTSQRKTYYFTDSGRVFKKMSDRSANISVDDRVKLDGGMLGSRFLISQNGVRVKVKEID